MGLKDIDSILKEEEVISQDSDSKKSDISLNFSCPHCGNIGSDDVLFLCNRCDSKEMIDVANVHICPNCLDKGDNFMCLRCDSKQVKLKNSIDSLV